MKAARLPFAGSVLSGECWPGPGQHLRLTAKKNASRGRNIVLYMSAADFNREEQAWLPG